MAKLLRDYPEQVYLGMYDDEDVYLARPSWDCGWCWGFGYVQNKNLHTHLSSMCKVDGRTVNLWDGLTHHIKAGKVHAMHVRNKLWTFCEVVQTIYHLRETAEVLGRGGSHYSTNPCADLIKNPDEVKRINEVLIPKLIDEMYILLGVVEPMEE